MPELEQICPGVYWVPGTMPSDTIHEPDIANAFLIERQGRAYLVDTGVGEQFRRTLAQFLQGRSYDSFTLINTHWHIDHVCNNDLIDSVAARTKQHLIHEAGAPYLDMMTGFRAEMATTARFYSPLRADEGWLRLSAAVMRSVAQVFPDVAYSLATRVMMRKFGAVRSETQYLRPLRVADRVQLHIGEASFLGWRTDELMLLDDGGHSPDSIVVYDPQCKLLLLGDLSYALNPLWASGTYGRTLENLTAYRSLVVTGQVAVLADAHNHQLFRGRAEILPLLDGLITAHKRRYDAIVQVRQETGLNSVEALRSALIDRNEEFRALATREFPHAYCSTRAMIAVAMQEQGALDLASGKPEEVVVMKVKDPVCKMEVDPEMAPAKFAYKGVTYYFCAPGCSKAFAADPEKYLVEAQSSPAPHHGSGHHHGGGHGCCH